MTMAKRGLVKRIVYFALGALFVGAIVAAWMPKPLPAEAAPASRGPMRVTVDEDGQARVKDRYVVSAPLAGSLARIELDPGDTVKQGQVLARIAPVAPALLDVRARGSAEARLAQALASQKQSQVQIERAQTNFQQAKGELERSKQLFEKGAGSRQALEQSELSDRRTAAELDSQKFAARVADFEVEMARATLVRLPGSRETGTQLEVPSPVGGRVLKVMHKSEGVVQPGNQLLEVGDPAALEVVVDVLTSDAARIPAGAPVTLDRWGGEPVEGRVRRVEPSAFTRLSALGVEEQRVNVLIDLTSPREKWAALGDGYRVEAHIVVWQASDVVRVPASAVFRDEKGWSLFRIIDGKARLTPVELGQRTTREVQVTKGLAGGEKVIVHPGDKIADGVRVHE
jgi:HlyD family secretion protein